MVLSNSWNPLQLFMITFCILLVIPHHATALSFDLPEILPKNTLVDIIPYPEAYISEQGLQVTPDSGKINLEQRAGRATYIKPFHLWDKASGTMADFSTHFLFVIDSSGDANFADGFAFFLFPNGTNVANITARGGSVGLPIDPNPPYGPTSPFVAVEFDTFQNGWDPININPVTHVGININSITSNVTAVWYANITGGIENEAWISYDSASKNLSVIFTGSINNTRIVGHTHSLVDLRNYLPEWVTFGFSASTGALFETHTVKSWKFNSTDI